MYEELIADLRYCADKGESCGFCKHYKDGLLCLDNMLMQAADAIEELQKLTDAQLDTIKQYQAYLNKFSWIPVAERLPIGGDDSGAICENVCLLMDDGTVSCGWMNGITKKVYYLNAIDDVVIKAPITRVTHWMPLPEPPKEET